MFHLAQTVGALYRQLHAAGYGPNQLRAVQKCFAFSNRVFSGVHHPCGKPLICHLVGTASAVTAMDARVEMVCAGLTHALLKSGLFQEQGGQARLEAEFGPSVYRLIAAFGQFRWDDETIAAFAAQPSSANATFRSMLILRLAKEMDDVANLGLALVPRRDPVRSRIQNCARIADGLGLRDAARTLELLIDEHESAAAWAGALNSGTLAPYRVLPNFLAYLRMRWAQSRDLQIH
jgi:(p)ppGpp synthase/HD superfamily hydrolase